MNLPKALLVAALIIITGEFNAFAESPLAASGEKKITVATEILRGAREILQRASDHGSFNLEDLDEQMETVLARNNAANTDSQGFLLGARFIQARLLDMFLHHKNAAANNYLGEIGRADPKIRRYVGEVRRLQKSLRLSDDELCAALGLETSRQEFQTLMADYSRPRPTPTPPPEPPPLPEFSPLPPTEFVKLKTAFTLVDAKGREVRNLPAGKRLRVIERSNGVVIIDSIGQRFSIPADITEPSQ